MAVRGMLAAGTNTLPLAVLGEPLIFGVDSSGDPCDAAVIWLHGFGDAPENFAKTLAPLRAAWPSALRWKWLHLRAPLVPQPCYDDTLIPAWGQLGKSTCLREVDLKDEEPRVACFLDSSVAAVKCVAEQLRKEGILAGRIVIGGFAQGAAVALQMALSFEVPLAGCIVFSGWMTPTAQDALQTRKCHDTPILVCHGVNDELVGFDCALAAVKALEAADKSVEFKKYPGLKHGVCAEELSALATFLHSSLAPPTLQASSEIAWVLSAPDSDDDSSELGESDDDDDGDEDETQVTYISLEAAEKLQRDLQDGHELSLTILERLEDVSDMADDKTMVPVRKELISDIVELWRCKGFQVAATSLLRDISVALLSSEDARLTAREWQDYLANNGVGENVVPVKNPENSSETIESNSTSESSTSGSDAETTDGSPPEKKALSCEPLG